MKKIFLNYTNSSAFFIGLFLISIFTFWPTYYSIFFENQFHIHFHVFFAVIWFSMLIVQPYLIKTNRLNLHRWVGKCSYFIAPMVVISILLLANNRLTLAPDSFYLTQTFLLYLQTSLAFIFAITYGLAIYFRKTKSIHARFMVATSFTFIDPIFARIFIAYAPNLAPVSNWFTFGAINLILMALSFMDRNHRKAKWVYPSLLIIYILIEIPIFFNLTGMSWWQSFAKWFGSLGI